MLRKESLYQLMGRLLVSSSLIVGGEFVEAGVPVSADG